jgi:hypothetical protein
VEKAPPIEEAGVISDEPVAKVRVRGAVVVKESLPETAKNPVIESARAIATLLNAKTESTARRLNMRDLRGQGESEDTLSVLTLGDAPRSLRGWPRKNKNIRRFQDTKWKIPITQRAIFAQKQRMWVWARSQICFLLSTARKNER